MAVPGAYFDNRAIAQEEQLGVMGTAKELAMGAMNPATWYRLDPRMYDVMKGRVRIFGTGAAPVRGLFSFLRGQAERGTFGAVATKSEFFAKAEKFWGQAQWVGLGARPPLDPFVPRDPGLGVFPSWAGTGAPRDVRVPAVPEKFGPEIVFEPRGRPAGRHARSAMRRAARGRRNLTGAIGTRLARARAAEERLTAGVARFADEWQSPVEKMMFSLRNRVTAFRKEAGRFGVRSALATELGIVGHIDAPEMLGATGRAVRGGARAAAGAGRAALVGVPRALKRIPFGAVVRGTGRFLARGVVAGAKAHAYWEMGKLMWDIINSFTEPLGRSAISVADMGMQAFNNIAKPEMGGRLAMTYMSRGAATERQRSLAAIGKAQLNARSALGQEASAMHY